MPHTRFKKRFKSLQSFFLVGVFLVLNTLPHIVSAQTCPQGQIYSPNFLRCIEDKGYDFSGYRSTDQQTSSDRVNQGVNNPFGSGVNNNSGAGVNNPSGSGVNNSSRGAATTLQNPLESDSLTEFLLDLIDVIILFAIPLIILAIIYAGFLYVMARGSEEQVTKATRALTYAVIGGLLILGAKLLLEIIQGTVDQLVR